MSFIGPFVQPNPYAAAQAPRYNQQASPYQPLGAQGAFRMLPPQYAAPAARPQAPAGNWNTQFLQPAWNKVKQGAQAFGQFAARQPVAVSGAMLGIGGAMMGCPYSAGMGAASAVSGYMMNRGAQ